MTAGLFIVLEGPDGSGKSTLLRPLVERMREAAVDPVVVREPGGTPAAEMARKAVLDPEHHLSPMAELFFYLALTFGLESHPPSAKRALSGPCIWRTKKQHGGNGC